MTQSKKQRRLWIIEVVVLNGLLIMMPIFFFDWLKNVIINFPEAYRSDTLAMFGLILAGSVAGNFAISYKGTKMISVGQRFLAHTTKFTLQLRIVFNLILATGTIEAGHYVDGLFIIGLLVFAAILLHNVWDVFRAINDNDS